ncbi:MAG: sulfotransferase family 2 domain-containing protein [Planctomycetaceae bacterium]|nr:sulfotransferase family 2 domain-containing protein [Planctomycetaceae bacterium]
MLAFIHINKTAGLTIRNILRNNFGVNNCDCPIHQGIRKSDWEWVKECYPILQSLHGHSVMPTQEMEEVFEGIRYFTFIRDPFKRCLSHYQHKNSSGKNVLPIKTWLPMFSNHMCKKICGEENGDHAIENLENNRAFVGITDYFDESLLLWRQWTELQNLNLNYIYKNKARSSILKNAVLELPHAIELIHEHNREDQKLFDYVCNVIYPRQKSNYGSGLEFDLKKYQSSKSSLPIISLQSIAGCAKRRMVYKPGIREWRKDWMQEVNRAA